MLLHVATGHQVKEAGTERHILRNSAYGKCPMYREGKCTETENRLWSPVAGEGGQGGDPDGHRVSFFF